MIVVICVVFSVVFNSLTVVSCATDEVLYDRLTDEAHFGYLAQALSSTRTLYPTTTNYSTFLAAYYDNLTYNFGVNYKQSCGYIGIAMLLSYYNTFLNDNIIPEQYDVCSMGNGVDMIERANFPGVMRDLVEDVIYPYDDTLKSMSATDYYAIMSSISDRSLHAKRLTIGASKGYYDFSYNLAPALTTFEERLVVLKEYFSNVASIEENEYEIYSKNRESNYSDDDERIAASNEVK